MVLFIVVIKLDAPSVSEGVLANMVFHILIINNKAFQAREFWANKIDPLRHHGSDWISTRWFRFLELQSLSANTIPKNEIC